jgi:hypothetical protein
MGNELTDGNIKRSSCKKQTRRFSTENDEFVLRKKEGRLSLADPVKAAIGHEYIGDADRAIGLLVVFEQGR